MTVYLQLRVPSIFWILAQRIVTYRSVNMLNKMIKITNVKPLLRVSLINGDIQMVFYTEISGSVQDVGMLKPSWSSTATRTLHLPASHTTTLKSPGFTEGTPEWVCSCPVDKVWNRKCALVIRWLDCSRVKAIWTGNMRRLTNSSDPLYYP